MTDEFITSRVITSPEAMKAVVYADYHKHSEELSGLHFNFHVKMRCGDILKAYHTIQKHINGDIIARFDQNGRQIPLFDPDDTTVFDGNCQTFLEQFNTTPGFVRITPSDELVSFIW